MTVLNSTAAMLLALRATGKCSEGPPLATSAPYIDGDDITRRYIRVTDLVAPRAGARIETEYLGHHLADLGGSPPVRGRGLKPVPHASTASHLRCRQIRYPAPLEPEQAGSAHLQPSGVSVRRIESEEPSTRRKSGHEPAPFGTTWH